MAPDTPERVCWDACIFIDYHWETIGEIEHIKPLVEEARNGDLVIVASTMAMVETFKIGKNFSQKDKNQINNFFDQEFIDLHALDERVAKKAQELRQNYDIRSADSIHIATAIERNAPVLLTNDGRRRKNKGTIFALDKELELLGPLKGKKLQIMTIQKYMKGRALGSKDFGGPTPKSKVRPKKR